MANTMYPTLADFGDVDTRLKIPTICGQMKLTDIGTAASVKPHISKEGIAWPSLWSDSCPTTYLSGQHENL